MFVSWKYAPLALAAIGLASCGESEPEARQGVMVVGSSTIYPFSQAVADATMAANPDMAPITVESTGTTDGIEAFCAGVGVDHPDVLDASRRMTAEELAGCAANGVTDVVELRVGTDGVVIISSADEGIAIPLTQRLIYQALAANPFQQEQTAQMWSDIDPALPGERIEVFGPSESSGTQTSLLELIMREGCLTNGGMAMLEDDEERFAEACMTLRSDSAYLPQGEDDDLIIRKVANNPLGLAIIGYNFFEANRDSVQAMTLNGIAPTAESIADGSYPASRPLYVYIKKQHLDVIPGLAPFIAQWASSWGPGGPLARIGLVPSTEQVRAVAEAAARDLPVLTAADLAEAGTTPE